MNLNQDQPARSACSGRDELCKNPKSLGRPASSRLPLRSDLRQNLQTQQLQWPPRPEEHSSVELSGILDPTPIEIALRNQRLETQCSDSREPCSYLRGRCPGLGN